METPEKTAGSRKKWLIYFFEEKDWKKHLTSLLWIDFSPVTFPP